MKVSHGGEGSDFSGEVAQAELVGGGVGQLIDGSDGVGDVPFGPADGVDVMSHIQVVISGAFPDEIATAWDSRNVQYKHGRRTVCGVLGVRVQTVTPERSRTREILIDDDHRHGLPEEVITVLGRPAVYWASLPSRAGGIAIDGRDYRDFRVLEVSSPHYRPPRYVF